VTRLVQRGRRWQQRVVTLASFCASAKPEIPTPFNGHVLNRGADARCGLADVSVR